MQQYYLYKRFCEHPEADWRWGHLGNARCAGRVEVKKWWFLCKKRWIRNFL